MLEELIQKICNINKNEKNEEIQSLILQGKIAISDIQNQVLLKKSNKKMAKKALEILWDHLGYQSYDKKDLEYYSLNNEQFSKIESGRFGKFCYERRNCINDWYNNNYNSDEFKITELPQFGFIIESKESIFHLGRNEIIPFFFMSLQRTTEKYELPILVYIFNKNKQLLNEAIEKIPDLIYSSDGKKLYYKDLEPIFDSIFSFILMIDFDLIIPKLITVLNKSSELGHKQLRDQIIGILSKRVQKYRKRIGLKVANTLVKDIKKDLKDKEEYSERYRIDIVKILLALEFHTEEAINYTLKTIEFAWHSLKSFAPEDVEHAIKTITIASKVIAKHKEKIDTKTALSAFAKFVDENSNLYTSKYHQGLDLDKLLFTIIDTILLFKWEDMIIIKAFYNLWSYLNSEGSKALELKKRLEKKLIKIIRDNINAYEAIPEVTETFRNQNGVFPVSSAPWANWSTFLSILIGVRSVNPFDFNQIKQIKNKIKNGTELLNENKIEESLVILGEAFEILEGIQGRLGSNILIDEKEYLQETLYEILREKYSSLIEESKNFLASGDFDQSDSFFEEAKMVAEYISIYCKDMKPVDRSDIEELNQKISEKRNYEKDKKALEKKKQDEKAQPYIQRGNDFLEKMDYEEAITTFEEVLKISPSNRDAINGINKATKKILISHKIITLCQKFQPKLPVTLTRFAELCNEKKDVIEQILKHLLITHKDFGEYFELEQVFIKSEGIDKELDNITSRYDNLKLYTCYSCGYPNEVTSKICCECSEKMLICNVCKLPITFGDDMGKCSLCEKIGHLVHLQEWTKVHGKCPSCLQDLPIEGVVPISDVDLKK